MVTTMQDILNEAIPIWEKRPSAGMCTAVYLLLSREEISADICIIVMSELNRYVKEIHPNHIYLQAALTERYGDEGFDYYYEVFKDWEGRRRPTRWQNIIYWVKRKFL